MQGLDQHEFSGRIKPPALGHTWWSGSCGERFCPGFRLFGGDFAPVLLICLAYVTPIHIRTIRTTKNTLPGCGIPDSGDLSPPNESAILGRPGITFHGKQALLIMDFFAIANAKEYRNSHFDPLSQRSYRAKLSLLNLIIVQN